ncbi:hypothetical protein LG651_05475 [Tamlana sp. 62-3]|uniref:Uncharacterized protein n=1 Tax=Neotamlana sargassicola TaxID=2883125 RepID=A0A9X1I4L3_9FLAO|nr:hypothetical protein [Tamlana sargassicola]MCB4807692.1 hypothetical protein [Tamlana sargassicola]
MKYFTLIVLIGLGIYFLSKLKPEPKVMAFKKSMTIKGCMVPDDLVVNSAKHKGCCNIKGRAYYIANQKH